MSSEIKAYLSKLFVLQATHATVAQVACDCLLLLCDKANTLLELYPNMPAKIIQVTLNKTLFAKNKFNFF